MGTSPTWASPKIGKFDTKKDHLRSFPFLPTPYPLFH